MSFINALMPLVFALAFAISPFLAPEFGGFAADQFPIPQQNPPVQPAGYAFSIWGLIYIWLIVGSVFGLVARRSAPEWGPMRIPLCISLAVGCVWLPVAVESPEWASALIVVMLVSALIALFKSPASDPWFAALPIGLYAGWLSAATCVSFGLLSAGYGWLSQDTAGLVFVFVALVLASAVQSQLNRAPSYGLAAIWALVGIVVANVSGNMVVAALAFGGAVALLRPVYKAWRS